MTYQFVMQPATPSAETRAALRQQAAATLAADDGMPDFDWKNATDPIGETPAIRPDDIVLWRGSNPLCPMYVRVVKVCCNDTVKVQSLCVPGVQWKLRLDEVEVK